MTNSSAVTIYTPKSPIRNPVTLLREMARDLVAARELSWRLFVRDIKSTYRQSFLGYIWAFLPPLATTISFTYLHSQNIINAGPTELPYVVYVLIGTLLWGVFSDSLNSPMGAINNNRTMLAKVNFPREAIIISAIGAALFGFAIRFTILIPLFIYFGIELTPTLLLAPVAVGALVLVALAIGVFLIPLNIISTDVSRALLMFMNFWMLLTPVVYIQPTRGLAAELAKINPITPLIVTGRAWIGGTATPDLTHFIYVAVGAVIALFIGWMLLRVTLPILIERMGN